MGADTGVGLTAAEFFGIGEGDLSPLVPVPVQPPRWTPNYSMAGTVEIPTYRPTNRNVISCDFICNSLINDERVVILIGNAINDSTRFFIGIERQSFIIGVGNLILTLNDQPIQEDVFFRVELSADSGSYSFSINGLVVSSGTYGGTLADIISIGSGEFTTAIKNGQITSVRITSLSNPANSRFYRSIIRSEAMPDSTVLVDELGDGSTNGTLTGFPTAQRWVPVLGTNQAYVGNLTATNVWLNGVGVGRFGVGRFGLTADATSGAAGSWGENAATVVPVGSLVKSGSVVGFVDVVAGNNFVNVIRVNNEADAQIQAAFEYPNVFDIDPFDSATEAYAGDLNRNDGFVLGVNTSTRTITAIGNSGGVTGSFTNMADSLVGSILTSGSGAQVQVTNFGGVPPAANSLIYTAVTGTPEQIQAGFQWPNHFTVTPP